MSHYSILRLATILTLLSFLLGCFCMTKKRLVWEPRGPIYPAEQPVGEEGIRDYQYRHNLVLRFVDR